MTTSPASFASRELVQRVTENLGVIRERIASSGRDAASVRIVAVTKTFGPDAVRAAHEVGLRFVGENYVDEMHAKRVATADLAMTWHYLGALQSNKIGHAVQWADLLCGVSRAKEIERIARTRPEMPIYVQVDYTNAQGRNGADPELAASLVKQARALNVDIRGLMTVPAAGVENSRSAFAALTRLADDLGLRERSMGMSDDLEIACELGSTEIRIGRALFGPRMATSPLT
ncbi:MAG: YggS family pyridoxal phosphate enzyme [Acidimicrobiales bacterium]